MFNSATKINVCKQAIYILLSAALLLNTALSASASSHHSLEETALKNDAYDCANDIQTQANHYKYQSTHQRAMTCMLTELKNYQQKNMTAHQQYFAYKAQAWLNYAIHQDSMNSRSSAGKQAAQNAETILAMLKSGKEKDLNLIQDIPSNSALMRPDLWAVLNALKESGGITSAPRELAFSEVALIWAATNQCQRDWRESGSHFRMADRWLEQAREAYINAHDSQTNVVLEQLIVHYYEQYAPLDATKDVCRGQVLMPIH
ncbi:hypothetical protein [Psychrobacter vallis]|uniref:hypothetical protein n=1 Tax=Psychrobacter vallis TaxID=248451 RepID=UPI0019190492|nr:hypothetical protein [Psychrobacter vallis]